MEWFLVAVCLVANVFMIAYMVSALRVIKRQAERIAEVDREARRLLELAQAHADEIAEEDA